MRSLETLGVSGDIFGVILTPLVLSRIPQDIRLEWAREGEGRASDLGFLLDFLYKEIKRRERSQSFQEKSEAISVKKVPQPFQPSVAAFHSSSTSAGRGKNCSFCSIVGHKSEECFSLRGLSKEDLIRKVQEKKLCFVCFGHHFVRNCPGNHKHCKNCKG